MRALRSLLLLAACLPALASAQVAPSETDADRLAAYTAARLSIAGFVDEGSDDARRFNRSHFGWQPYRGDERVGEEAFYGLVGRDDLTARARARRGTANRVVILGVTAMAVGTALLAVGAIGEQQVVRDPNGLGGFYTYNRRVENTPLVVGGAVAVTAGFVAVQFALPMYRRRATHAQEANDMAERYNADVARMLSAPPPSPATIDG